MRRREETGVWWASPHAAAVISLVPAVLAVFVLVHEMTLHDAIGGVSFPSAGTNFASALSLSRGNVLYNTYPTSFPLTQPPGMSLLLLPFAWAAHGGDSSGSMAAARVFTVMVSVVDVLLVGLMARRHGLSSSFVAGTLFALFPFAFYATASYTLEPYLVLFCLLSLMAAFSQGLMVHGSRLIWAGVFMGFAVTIKPWALIPALALLICAAINWREALGRVAGGLAIGIFVPCVYFFLASPSSFISDVLGAEFSTGGGVGSNPGGSRLAEVLGLGPSIGLKSGGSLAVAVAGIIAILVVLGALARLTASSWQDWAILGTTAGLAAIAFLPSSLPVAYTYFLAAFGAILLGNTVGKLVATLSTLSVGTADTTSTVAGGATILVIAGMIGVMAVCAPKEASFERAYFIRHANNPTGFLDKAVPANSCVISNNPEALVLAGRFAETPSNCPVFPDPEGIMHVAGSGATIGSATVVGDWERAMGDAQYFVEAPGPARIPWSYELQAYFRKNFILESSKDGYKIYLSRIPRALETP